MALEIFREGNNSGEKSVSLEERSLSSEGIVLIPEVPEIIPGAGLLPDALGVDVFFVNPQHEPARPVVNQRDSF